MTNVRRGCEADDRAKCDRAAAHQHSVQIRGREGGLTCRNLVRCCWWMRQRSCTCSSHLETPKHSIECNTCTYGKAVRAVLCVAEQSCSACWHAPMGMMKLSAYWLTPAAHMLQLMRVISRSCQAAHATIAHQCQQTCGGGKDLHSSLHLQQRCWFRVDNQCQPAASRRSSSSSSPWKG